MHGHVDVKKTHVPLLVYTVTPVIVQCHLFHYNLALKCCIFTDYVYYNVAAEHTFVLPTNVTVFCVAYTSTPAYRDSSLFYYFN